MFVFLQIGTTQGVVTSEMGGLSKGILQKEIGDGSHRFRETHSKVRATTILPMESSLSIVSHEQLSEQHKICRIKGICRVGDGTILLPTWMKEYSGHMEKCGFSDVSYSMVESKSELGDKFIALRGVKNFITLKDDYRDYDIVGNEVPKGGKHELAYDITPTILMMDMFKRADAYRDVTKKLCVTKEGTACPPETTEKSPLFNPVLLIDSRISETKDYMWPKSLLRLVRNSLRGNLTIVELKELYEWKVRSQAACFRSIISTNMQTSDLAPEALLPNNIFFSINGLNRKSAERPPHAPTACNVKVLILNRYGKRFIEGGSELTSSILSFGQQLSKVDHGVLIEPEVVFFENSSFHEQVSVMQETSVVVASHGENNANFMFLRPNTRIFEVLPFGFASDIYRNLSAAYGAIYAVVRSQPDIDLFSACVRHFNPDAKQEREKFLEKWKTVAKEFREETIQKNANVDSDYVVTDDEVGTNGTVPSLTSIRPCTSYQRISFDINDLARKVVMAGARQCHVQGDLSFLSP